VRIIQQEETRNAFDEQGKLAKYLRQEINIFYLHFFV
jgi:hypothetical protein